MAQYIDKEALVAEIERRIKETESMQPKFDQFWAGQISAFKGVLKILDTIDTKEVDLENSVKGRIDYPLIGVDFPNIYPNYKELKDYCDKNGIKDGDKVKIIIIKDDIL